MDIINIEKALTASMAAILGLEVDKTIFRGSLPANKRDAIGILINAANRGNGPTSLAFTAQILGRYTSRDNALAMLDKIDTALPFYGDEIAGDGATARLSIIKIGSGGIYPTIHDGKNIYGLSFNLRISVM